MGLDACVYCDCFVQGKTLSPPPVPPERIITFPDGSLGCLTPSPNESHDVDIWLEMACEHEDAMLVLHHLGNITRIGAIRRSLSMAPERFPLLLSKVVYNGVHAGDFINPGHLSLLAEELVQLRDFHPTQEGDAPRLVHFHQQMLELLQAAESVSKPIAF